MKRRKINKVRTTISLDAQVFEESGYYIYNLSAFVEECIKREIDKQKKKQQLRISTNKQSYKETNNDDEYIKVGGQLKKSSEMTTDDVIKMIEEFYQ